MTRDDIIRMAREAGWSGIYTKPLFSITMKEDDFLRFAALVAAEEREACALIVDEIVERHKEQWDITYWVLRDTAFLIRNRREKE